jgi:hypothetical protein
MAIVTGLDPVMPFGTVNVTEYCPDSPGVRTLEVTAAFWPPIITIGVAVVAACGEDGPGSPVSG